MKVYLVYSKGDDYGARRMELVEATEETSKEYYHCKKVAKDDVEVLKKYLGLVTSEEEMERTNEQRFYGN